MTFIPLAILVLAPTAPPESPSPTDRAAAVIAQKARMPNRYTLKLRVETRAPNAPPPQVTASSGTLHVWREGKKFRVDYFDAQSTPPRASENPKARRIGCENCEREGYGITTTVLPGTPPITHAVEFKRLGTWSFDIYCTNFDWRYFGLSNDPRTVYPRLHIAANFPKFFGLPDIQTKSEKRGELPCLVASRKVAGHNTSWSVWLSERDGFNPVYFEEKFDVEGVPEIRTTEIGWQQTPGGYLFPKQVKHNTMITSGGKKFEIEEVTTITHADFDSPIDPTVFTLAGFGLNENQVIFFPDLEPQERPRWRNGKLDYSNTSQKRLDPAEARTASGPPVTAPYPSQGSTTMVIGIIAAVLAVGTAIAAIVIRRRRAAS